MNDRNTRKPAPKAKSFHKPFKSDLGIRKRVSALFRAMNLDSMYLPRVECGMWIIKDGITLIAALRDLIR